MIPLIELAATLARAGAPSVAKALRGNKAAAAVMDVAAALGTPPSVAAISDKLASDPAALERLMAYELQLSAMEIADIQSAREAHKKSIMPALLTVLIAAMMCSAGYGLFNVEIPEPNRDMANIAFGALLGAFGTAVAYWLGSSIGSHNKEQLLMADRASGPGQPGR